MKKTLLLYILCAAPLLCLTACGAAEAEATPEPSPEPTAEAELVTLAPVLEADVEEASAAEAAALQEDEPPASPTDAQVDEEAYAAAEGCVGESLEALYAAVGEPTSARYAASCLEEDAEDGMLFYEELGFYVWTVKDAEAETVHAVYPLD